MANGNAIHQILMGATPAPTMQSLEPYFPHGDCWYAKWFSRVCPTPPRVDRARPVVMRAIGP
jgi:hypothetical protein